MILLVLLGFLASDAVAFRSLPSSLVKLPRNCAIKMSADGLETLYNSLTSKLQSTFDLMATDFTSTQEADQFDLKCVDGLQWQGGSTWLSEQKGSKLTGVSKFYMKEVSGKSTRYNIDAWLGPGYLVPHLTLSFGTDTLATGETVCSIRTDYIPRGPFPFGSDPSYLDSFYKVKQDIYIYVLTFIHINNLYIFGTALHVPIVIVIVLIA